MLSLFTLVLIFFFAQVAKLNYPSMVSYSSLKSSIAKVKIQNTIFYTLKLTKL